MRATSTTATARTARFRVVLPRAGSPLVAAVQRQFRALGWRVTVAADGSEARRFVRAHGADLVLLDGDDAVESGWLSCAKLRLEAPEVAVLLLVSSRSVRTVRFGRFLGATGVIGRDEGSTMLVREALRISELTRRCRGG